uniref:Uncharacterized protein n=1 Tax=viral metagenome TaxID=1070528 RepID=A0A6C0DS92_9ZZZZ
MSTCKALVTGKRSGEQCRFPPSETNPFCGRHQRNYQHDQLVNSGKLPCSKFFRGCDTTVEKAGMCTDCKVKYMPKSKTGACKHEGCKFKTKGQDFCGKHSRDIHLVEEKEKNIKYCDIARGCLTVCEEGYTRCTACREKSNTREKELRDERTLMHNVIVEAGGDTQLCVNCGSDYTAFTTRYNKQSLLCQNCNATNAKQDAKRVDRVRNYKEERRLNLQQLYKDYNRSATKRGLTINLQADDFKALVVKPCYYCGYFKETEVNGIDRINNDIGYEKTNCVPCCEICNRLKHYFHPSFFIKLCHIFNGATASKAFYEDWSEYYGRNSYHNYSNYKKMAERNRDIEMEITQEDWDRLTRQACYLCGFRSVRGIGLDRVDNSERVYRLDNLKPCCGTCNDIKSTFSLDQIKAHAARIIVLWPTTEMFDSLPRMKNPMVSNGTKTERTERIHWRATSVYYDILADGDQFYIENKLHVPDSDYQVLKAAVKTTTRASALKLIKGLLDSVKKSKR